MRTNGHTVQRAVTKVRYTNRVSLECTCGVVFASTISSIEDLELAHAELYRIGKSKAARHIALMEEVNKTSSAEQPCAA